MIRLSIIVPFYNVEKYLKKCLKSLVTQNIPFTDYEIILINDGSDDKSLEIANVFADKYFNIKVFSQENRGLGGARNTGMEHASGRYLLFVDSDDYLENNCLKNILEKAENEEVDILHFNFRSVNENYEIIPEPYDTIKFTGKTMQGKYFLEKYFGLQCYAVLFLYKVDYLRKMKFLFFENCYLEDVLWLPEVIINSQKVLSLDIHIYNYLQRPDSIMNNKNLKRKEKLLNDQLYVIEYLIQFQKLYQSLWAKSLLGYLVIVTEINVIQFVPDKSNQFKIFIQNMGILPLKTNNLPYKCRFYILLINKNINASFFVIRLLILLSKIKKSLKSIIVKKRTISL